MKKKLLLLGLGIAAVLVVACRVKNIENEPVSTDNTNNETGSGSTTTDMQNKSDNQTQIDNTETPNTETPSTDSKSKEEGNTSDQERNLNYKDVDIKVPSIHED